jgi:hypothetical protein
MNISFRIRRLLAHRQGKRGRTPTTVGGTCPRVRLSIDAFGQTGMFAVHLNHAYSACECRFLDSRAVRHP